MKNVLKAAILFFLFLGVNNRVIYCAEDASVSKIQRSQEILEKEKALRERIEKGEKVFIKKITVSGITLLKENQIKKAILPFKNRWLSKDEIQGIVDLIIATYKQSGYSEKVPKIFYKIKKNNLNITVEEQ